MPETELALLTDAARAAGEIARAYFGKAPKVWEKPGGLGPVTEADIEIDRMLRVRLTAARPDYGWLSEESADAPQRLQAERVFIVDPIDGTRAFVAGEQGFSHSLALTERGHVIAAVVHLPMLQRTYAAVAGGGAFRDDQPIRASARAELEDADILANATQMEPKFWPGGVPRIRRHFRPSLAHRLCLAAEGQFDGMLTLRDTWEWDVAAGDLIAREAGALVTTRDRCPVLYNQPRPLVRGMVVAGPELHEKIMARL